MKRFVYVDEDLHRDDRDRTDDLFHAIKMHKSKLLTAKWLDVGKTGKIAPI
jgi:hypothetical protein